MVFVFALPFQPRPGPLAHHYISVYTCLPPVSSCLKFCNCSLMIHAAPALFGTASLHLVVTSKMPPSICSSSQPTPHRSSACTLLSEPELDIVRVCHNTGPHSVGTYTNQII